MKKILICITLAAAFGCEQLEIKDPKDGTNGASDFARASRIESSSLESNLKVDIRGADPEKYAVHFTWPYLKDNKILRIRLGTVLAEVQPKQAYFNYILDHSQTATFSFDVLDGDRKQERTFRVPVVIPSDFVVRDSNYVLTNISRIEVNRLFLDEKFPLTTMGRNLDIVTSELHPNHGVIETFPEFIKNPISGALEAPTAQPHSEGASGGNITISTKKLIGRLVVNMRGQNGGIGHKGDPTPGKGNVGDPAKEGQISCEDDTPDCSRFPGACMVPQKYLGRCQCVKPGAPGGAGGIGAIGAIGRKGMRGGDSGNIRVSVQEYVPLEGFDPSLPQTDTEIVKINQIPGSGGAGGPGGDGQQGGDGGLGSRSRSDCLGGDGPQGPRGPQGPAGPTGDSAKAGLKCLYIGSENVNECIQ